MTEKYNLKEWFQGQTKETRDKYGHMQKHYTPLARPISKNEVVMLFCGIELTLLSDGTYILSDTTGG